MIGTAPVAVFGETSRYDGPLSDKSMPNKTSGPSASHASAPAPI